MIEPPAPGSSKKPTTRIYRGPRRAVGGVPLDVASGAVAGRP